MILQTGLLGIEISRDHIQNELGRALPGASGSGKNASIDDTISTVRDIFVEISGTSTTGDSNEPPRDASPIFQTPVEANAQTLTSPSIGQEEPACMVPNGTFDRAVEFIGEGQVEQSGAKSILHVCKVAYIQAKNFE